MLVCQLTKQHTLVPVCTKYGTLYDKNAISAYINKYHMDPQVQSPLTLADLIPIDMTYLTQQYKPDFSDEKEKMLSRLLYERDALVRIVAKGMEDQPSTTPPKRKKTYTWHHFKQDIEQADLKSIRKQWNKQMKQQKWEWTQHPTTDTVDHHIHPLTNVSVVFQSKIQFLFEGTCLHEMPPHTRRPPHLISWHCDLSIFFCIYNTFIDIYSLSGYVDTWHIKHNILDLKCCGNGYLVAILHEQQQIDIFDLRKLSTDNKGLLTTLPANNTTCLGFLKDNNLLALGPTSTSFYLI